MLSKNIIQQSSYLNSCIFINNMQYWTIINIYYVNKYGIIEITIFFKVNLKRLVDFSCF